VRNALFSTGGFHRADVAAERFGSVFPVVHTPYDFYERI
jgi:acyl-CoA thioesterase FadM